jgi:hypothetical protein
MCTTRSNDGIFTVHRFSVATSARLHQSGCGLDSSYIFDNPPGFLSARGQVVFVIFFFSFFFCLNVNSGVSSPEGAQLP